MPSSLARVLRLVTGGCFPSVLLQPLRMLRSTCACCSSREVTDAQLQFCLEPRQHTKSAPHLATLWLCGKDSLGVQVVQRWQYQRVCLYPLLVRWAAWGQLVHSSQNFPWPLNPRVTCHHACDKGTHADERLSACN